MIRTTVTLPDAGVIVLTHPSREWAAHHLKSARVMGGTNAKVEEVPDDHQDPG